MRLSFLKAVFAAPLALNSGLAFAQDQKPPTPAEYALSAEGDLSNAAGKITNLGALAEQQQKQIAQMQQAIEARDKQIGDLQKQVDALKKQTAAPESPK